MSTLIWTTAGRTRLLAATPESPLSVAKICVSDGGGINPPINGDTTALSGDVWWRGTASNPIRDPSLPTQMKFEAIIPADVGGVVRQVGLEGPDGVLLAVANTSTAQKPSSEGGGTPTPMTVSAAVLLDNPAQTTVVVSDQPYIAHGALSGRATEDAHPMAAITGLTGRQSFNATELLALPPTISGAVSLKSTVYNMRAVLPKAADLLSAVEVTLYLSHDSTHPVMVRAATGDELAMPEDVKYHNVPGELILRPTGGWVTLRSVNGGWEVVACNTHLRDPSEGERGMPLVATQEETNSGLDDKKYVTPAKMRAGFSAHFAGIGYITFPTWLGGLIIQWGNAVSAANSTSTITLPMVFPTEFYFVLCGVGDVAGTREAFPFSAAAMLTNGTFRLRSYYSNAISNFYLAIGR